MKKKIGTLLLILAMILTITGCVSLEDEKTVKNAGDIDTEGNETAKAMIEEKVIFDKEQIKITAKSIKYDGWFGPEIKLLIENNSTKNITVQDRNFSINGIMIDATLSANVVAGKKSNDSITIYDSTLEKANISTIKDIEFDLSVFDADNWKDISTQTGIKIETNATNYVQKYNDSGTLVVNQNDIKIYVLKMNDKDSFWGADIYVYIENNSTQDITVQARDVSINGFMIDPVFSSEVVAGKKAYDSITLFESDLKDNNITNITEMELKFYVFNKDNWKNIFETNSKKIEF